MLELSRGEGSGVVEEFLGDLHDPAQADRVEGDLPEGVIALTDRGAFSAIGCRANGGLSRECGLLADFDDGTDLSHEVCFFAELADQLGDLSRRQVAAGRAGSDGQSPQFSLGETFAGDVLEEGVPVLFRVDGDSALFDFWGEVDVCHLGFASRGSFFQGDTIFEAADLGFDLLEFLGLVSVQVSGAVILSGVQDRALVHDQSGALLFQFVNLHL